ncbi:hypothetical protein PYCCODRAFT_765107 [Trametes coccinea BRFM310]|uniref:Uncharacterized protein n=1 Tax=Trametes coccinea (strain BRFM310) TaxID=1353009 RepID=A0A1Y2J2X0_TRAC3|nr:hypothetical protein PYCCODRAFT_765107 [Trametes coccinea BRFM310]
MSKTNVERAKAENKFFAAMRDKESSDQERKNLTRNLDKAGKALDKLAESEKALTTRIHLLEKEAANLKRVADAQKEQTSALQSESNEWRMRFLGERKTVEEIRTAFQEHSTAIDKKRTELRKIEESLLKAKSSVEKQAAKLKSLSSSSGSNAREAELQSEIDKCMPPQMLHLQDEHAQYRHHEMHAHILQALRRGTNSNTAAQVPSLQPSFLSGGSTAIVLPVTVPHLLGCRSSVVSTFPGCFVLTLLLLLLRTLRLCYGVSIHP